MLPAPPAPAGGASAERPRGAQADLPVVVRQGLQQRLAGLLPAQLAKGRRRLFANLPLSVRQRRAERRQHRRLAAQAEGAGGRPAYLRVDIGAGQPGQFGQGRLVAEPAEHRHRLAAHRRLRIAEGGQGRRGALLQAQFAQRTQYAGADEGIGMPEPRQQAPPGGRFLEFAKALRGGIGHRRHRIGQGRTERIDHCVFLPGLQQARGLAAHAGVGIAAQGRNQQRQRLRQLQVGQFDQRQAAYAGVGVLQARRQFEDFGRVAFLQVIWRSAVGPG